MKKLNVFDECQMRAFTFFDNSAHYRRLNKRLIDKARFVCYNGEKERSAI